MIGFDGTTVLLLNFIYSLTVTLLIVFGFLPRGSKFSGLVDWGAGLILFSINFALLFINGIHSIKIFGFLPHILTIIAFILVKKGLMKFMGRENRWLLDIIFVIFGSTLLIIYNSYPHIKIYLIIIFQLIIVVDTIYLALSAKDVNPEKKKVVAACFFGIAVLQIVRLYFGAQWNAATNPYDTELSLAIISSLFFVIYIILTITMIFILLNKTINKQSLLIEELEQTTLYDELTGLYNRRGFNQLFGYEFKVKKRKKNPSGYVLALCDIDFFKKVNDTYGHDAGDFVLAELAKKLKNHTRESDLVSRWGGEEFLIYFSNVESKENTIILDEIRENIQNSKFIYGKTIIPITISIGAVYTADTANDLQELLKLADIELYKSKANGRNNVHTYYCEGEK
jgi:diguanylate cyclase (GGDEF)-like protein